MSAFTIRLPDELERQLAREARRTRKNRSELAREILDAYLRRIERERFMTDMLRAAELIGNDAASMHEARQWVEAAVDDGLDTLAEAERAAGHDATQRWWE